MTKRRAFTKGDRVQYDGYKVGTVTNGPTLFGSGEELVQIENQYHQKLWFAVELVSLIS